MKSLNELIKDVERDLMVNLTLSTRHNKLTMQEASVVANKFLTQNLSSYEDLFNNLYSLSTFHGEVRKVYVKYSPEYYEQKRLVALKQLRSSINCTFKEVI